VPGGLRVLAGPPGSSISSQPGHIHYVIQPVTREQMAAYEAFGPSLQVAMSRAGDFPGEAEVANVAEQARQLFMPGR